MRFKQFMEDVIDKSDEFKKKKGENFRDRIHKGVMDANDGINAQKNMETYVNDSILKLVKKTNRKFDKFKLQIWPIIRQFKNQPDYFIPNLFYLLGDADVDEGATGLTAKDRTILKNFVEKYPSEVEKILDEHEESLNEIETLAKEKKWPAGPDSLNRYTTFPHAKSDIRLAREGLKELTRD